MNDEHDRIDVALARAFVVPDLSAVHATIDAAVAAHERPRRARRWWFAATGATAAIVATLVATWVLARLPDVAIESPEPGPPDPARVLGDRLARLHADGPALPQREDASCLAAPRTPDACVGDVPQLDADGLELVGLELVGECGAPGGPPCDPAAIPTPRLVHVRDVGGDDILVAIVPQRGDPRPVLPGDGGLSIFRRELGTFVAYEITPLPEPLVLAQLQL